MHIGLFMPYIRREYDPKTGKVVQKRALLPSGIVILDKDGLKINGWGEPHGSVIHLNAGWVGREDETMVYFTVPQDQ